MDPLTHTLVGANLASTRLGTTTRLGAAACLIGANAPDIDVTAYFRGEDFAIGFRRGWTHGLLALVVLPIALWALLMLWDRVAASVSSRRNREGFEAPRSHPGWLFALCMISILTHPFLDWLNVYGMRWLMPFDGTWFYGDSVFIMDPWLWLILAGFWLLPRRPTKALVIVWALFSGLLALVVAGRAPGYLPLIATIAAVLLATLVWKPGLDNRKHVFGLAGLAAAGLYIAGMIVLHAQTSHRVEETAVAAGVEVRELLVGPLPVDSLRWDVLIRTDDEYRYGAWSWWSRELELDDSRLPLPYESELWAAASNDPTIAGFVDWVRYPWIDSERVEGGTRVWILDARYSRSRQDGFGSESVVVPDARD